MVVRRLDSIKLYSCREGLPSGRKDYVHILRATSLQPTSNVFGSCPPLTQQNNVLSNTVAVAGWGLEAVRPLSLTDRDNL